METNHILKIMDRKKDIKRKIKALLEKGNNGSTEAEAAAFISHAQKLMEDYYISKSELESPFVGEEVVILDTNMHRSCYRFNGFYHSLSQLFDCYHYYNNYNKTISFVGFKPDTEMCVYFYHYIINATLLAKKKYMKSDNFKEDKQYYHSRRLAADYIKGFLGRIDLKIYEMIDERNKKRKSNIGDSESSTSSLILFDEKLKRVEDFYGSLGIKTVKHKDIDVNYLAYNAGLIDGSNLDLNIGIQGAKNNNKLLD